MDKDGFDKFRDPEDESKGYRAVTTKSFLICRYGGIIEPLDSGQVMIEGENSMKNTQKNYYEIIGNEFGFTEQYINILKKSSLFQISLDKENNVLIKGPYSYLEDSSNVEPGKNFTKKQKQKIIEENMKINNGKVKSDLSGEELVKPEKSKKGVTPNSNEWQIDHIKPKEKGGTNSYSNAQVLSRKENRKKWNKWK